jgi:D-serine deaminase-like pyridoxal phosphate-dependent protein
MLLGTQVQFLEMQKDELDTPALLVNLDKMERNIERMARFAEECDVDLRPHVKTHKVPEIAKIQLNAGAKGICVQKVSEAEVFLNSGIDDIFITNEIVGSTKLNRLADLASKGRLAVAVDNSENVSALSKVCNERGAELTVLVDVDVGMNRCGVSPAGASTIARQVSRGSNLIFGGLMVYEGHVGGASSDDDRARESKRATELISEAKQHVEKAGLKVERVSMGSSVSVWTNAKHPEVTEVQPGMYIFNDGFLMHNKVARPDDCALTVLCTVMSRPGSDRAVVDAGSKAFQLDQGKYPIALHNEGVEMMKFSEEHGWLNVKGKGVAKLGERIEFIPYHCCTCVNQYDQMFGVRGGKIESVWKISARGMMT